MGGHLPIELVQRVKGPRSAAPIEKGQTGMACAGGAPPHRGQIGNVLGEHQLRVPVQRAAPLGFVEDGSCYCLLSPVAPKPGSLEMDLLKWLQALG